MPGVVGPDSIPIFLQRIKNKSKRGSKLPYDPQYTAEKKGLQQQLVDYFAQNRTQEGRTNEDYLQENSNLGRDRTRAVGSLQADMADRGLLHSGINVQQQGKVAEGYGEDLGNLQTGVRRNLEDLSSGRTSANQGYLSDLGGAEANRVRRFVEAQMEAAKIRAEREANLDMLRQIQGARNTYGR